MAVSDTERRPIPTAVAYIRPMGRGGAESHLLRFDDGKNRVVKFSNNPQGPRTLVNELVTTRLAKLLGVPVPHGQVVVVPQELIDVEPGLRRRDGQKFAGGLCFGSEYHEALDDPGPATLARVTNKDALPGIVVLDTWCSNTDRENVGNLLLTTGASGEMVMAIDHGHCFGHNWTAETLTGVATQVRVVCRRDFRQFLQSVNAFAPYLEKLLNVTIIALQEALSGIPQEWGATKSDIDALGDFLFSRREAVAQAIRATFQDSVL